MCVFFSGEIFFFRQKYQNSLNYALLWLIDTRMFVLQRRRLCEIRIRYVEKDQEDNEWVLFSLLRRPDQRQPRIGIVSLPRCNAKAASHCVDCAIARVAAGSVWVAVLCNQVRGFCRYCNYCYFGRHSMGHSAANALLRFSLSELSWKTRNIGCGGQQRKALHGHIVHHSHMKIHIRRAMYRPRRNRGSASNVRHGLSSTHSVYETRMETHSF